MRRNLTKISPLPLVMLLFAGCHSVGDKAANISVIYGAAAVLSLILLICYCFIHKKRDPWYLLLFASVMVVNIGYFALAISRSLDEALLANRLAYLGSVFLPLAMWMIVANTTHIRYHKWIPGVLVGISLVVFLIAATPGYLPIYYKDVTFEIVHGVATLVKTYGPLHGLYLVYLLAYFGAMIVMIIHATIADKIDSLAYSAILAIAVFVNLGVWLIEQLVYIDFEMLSISYIITESFLLGLHVLKAEAERQKQRLLEQSTQPVAEQDSLVPDAAEQSVASPDQEAIEMFLSGLSCLTPKEREIYECYIAGMTTDVIMEKLAIKENTLKFHNKNLYSKLGVKSRRQLVELSRKLP